MIQQEPKSTLIGANELNRSAKERPRGASERRVFEIEPERIAYGIWCHRTQKTLGQGDINASYSAERIGMDQPIRMPFTWHGELWICVGVSRQGGELVAEAYRLVHLSRFEETPTTYREKFFDPDAARADPKGFYHRMCVKHAGGHMVLCGTPVFFVAGRTRQLDLFG